MKIFVARQPIFNKNKKVVAYELLFRDSLNNYFPQIEASQASSRVLSSSFASIGIDNVSYNRPVFVNFNKELILRGIPFIFPKEKLVVEILEDVDVDDELLEAVKNLRSKNYRIALDDFFYKSNIEALIKLAHIIKIDFRADQGHVLDNLVKSLCQYNKILLAEKVETYEEFENAKKKGFSMFQGYFFSKPEILVSTEISPQKVNIMLAIAQLSNENSNFGDVEEFIKRDPGISYKLLKYINSAFFSRPTEIKSIRHALNLLGEKEIRSFLMMLLLADLGAEKPEELIQTSVVMAKFCELLGKDLGSKVDENELFTVGLFSMLDAIMDRPMELAIKGLPLSERIVKALLGEEDLYTDVLRLVKAYMRGDWNEVEAKRRLLNLESSLFPEAYFHALKWAHSLEFL